MVLMILIYLIRTTLQISVYNSSAIVLSYCKTIDKVTEIHIQIFVAFTYFLGGRKFKSRPRKQVH